MPQKSFFRMVALSLLLSGSMLYGQSSIQKGLVSYWPLDTVSADGTTPDLASGNDLTLTNMDSGNLVDGKFGKALSFDGVEEFAYHQDTNNNGLPIYAARSYTVMLWVKGDGNGQNDRRVFSESSDQNNSPLLNIGTDHNGSNDHVDIYLRNDDGSNPINHTQSAADAFDGSWHNLAWQDDQGTVKLYVDGVLDTTSFDYTRGTLTPDITSIGGILRDSPCCLFQGDIDDVAVWERALSQDEIVQVMNQGIPTPIPPSAPEISFQPVGQTRAVGDRVTFSVTAMGSRPFTYQWQKNGQSIAGATNATLTLTQLTPDDSGSYSVVVSNAQGSQTSDQARLTVPPDPAPDLSLGLVSYWPFDEVNETNAALPTTPDLYSRNDMVLNGMSSANLVDGKFGKALTFYGVQEYTSRVGGFPIYNNNAYSVSLWVNGDGVGQSDVRVFSEGSTNNNTPLFTIGTDAGGANGQVRIFIRTDSGSSFSANSTAEAFDGTWHHLVWVDDNGNAKLYIDGVLDATDFSYTRGTLTLDTTSVGAVLRATASNFFSGSIDDVAVWNRVLSATEIQQIETAGIPPPSAPIAPQISVQPVGAEVYGGATVTFTVNATGTSPLAYQWYKDGDAVAGATGNSLTLPSVQASDSGSYTVTVSNDTGSATSDAATLAVTPVKDITTAMVAYWPFEVVSNTTPDVVGSNDLQLVNMDASNVTDGHSGKALSFNGTDEYLAVTQTHAGVLPIYQQGAYSVSLWVKGDAGQSDRRVFSESSTVNNSPLFNIGTDNSGASGSVDIYIRNDDGTATVNHALSTTPAFDGTWHHLVWVDDHGNAALYIDGQRDSTDFSYSRGTMTLNTTSVGGILRSSACCWFAGDIDEVAVWRRVLSNDEIQYLTENGPVPQPPELQITQIQPSGADILLNIFSAHPNREHHVEETTDLTNPAWTQVSNVTFTGPNGNTLQARFLAPTSGSYFYRASNIPPPPVLQDDFESGADGWTHGGVGDSWQLGTPTSGPNSAHSGTNVWATNLSGPYDNSTAQWLRSPVLDLTQATSGTLTFWEFRDVEPLFQGQMYDFTTVSVKDASDPNGPPLAKLAVDVGSETQWTQRTLHLPSEALGKHVLLEFLLTTDEFQPSPQAGWYIDDVSVSAE